jgi:hypothetical protein
MEINFWQIIITAGVVFVFNGLFYLIIKRSIDNRINRFKIAYSGLFAKKIEVYQKMLDLFFKIDLKIKRYSFSGNSDYEEQIFELFDEIVHYRLVNSPFLSDKVNELWKNVIGYNQEKFEIIHAHYFYQREGVRDEVQFKKYFKTIKGMTKDSYFEKFKNQLIKELKSDLNPL